MAARVRDEARQRGLREVSRERAGGLVRRVEHHAAEPGSGAARDESEIGCAVGEEHGNHTDAVARGRGERRQRCFDVAGEDAELHDVDAGRGHGAHGGQHRLRCERHIADGGAGQAAPGDGAQDRGDGRIRQPPQRALRRFLEVDDVGAAGDCDLRFAGRADARQKPGHRALSAVASR